MKKFISVLLAITILMSLNITVFASTPTSNVYIMGDKTIIFEESSAFTSEEQQYIAEFLTSQNSEQSTYGLMCNLFGHKNTQESVIAITHRVYENSPRCMQEIFLVTTCSRCNETSTELVSRTYITCCPED